MPVLGEPCGGYGCASVVGRDSRIVQFRTDVGVHLCCVCVSALDMGRRAEANRVEASNQRTWDMIRSYIQGEPRYEELARIASEELARRASR